jgi:WD40 repeat protein
MTEILSIMICVMMINVINSQTADTFLQYGTGLSTAMDVEYTSNLAAFATLGYQIFFYNSGVTGLMYSINTGHKANITTLSISPDASLILTGSKDFTARVYSIPSGSQQCAFLELRGEVISSKIGSDNDFYAFGTMEGYLYYGSITTCSITKLVLGNQFKSVEIIVERN